jgi:hypothetical protein
MNSRLFLILAVVAVDLPMKYFCRSSSKGKCRYNDSTAFNLEKLSVLNQFWLIPDPHWVIIRTAIYTGKKAAWRSLKFFNSSAILGYDQNTQFKIIIYYNI